MNRQKCLDAAAQAVNIREQSYDLPLTNFPRIAELWSIYLGIPIRPDQVGWCQILLKVARSMGDPKNTDNPVDTAGYAACIAEVITND